MQRTRVQETLAAKRCAVQSSVRSSPGTDALPGWQPGAPGVSNDRVASRTLGLHVTMRGFTP
eukprot:CAMPEP_0175785506 /NCGR_PEP_ID=MMETSP0097-20121207/79364_1 /TAXON_ID=311494 /ORGANISM="Alexandrium monilatum, Strain CCMP3105" /LENGTH=61 /DNA_ID=CAMNT_0017096421 /DNA_START=37 /DNA_END=218 /DNA_ORIENTATION=-